MKTRAARLHNLADVATISCDADPAIDAVIVEHPDIARTRACVSVDAEAFVCFTSEEPELTVIVVIVGECVPCVLLDYNCFGGELWVKYVLGATN